MFLYSTEFINYRQRGVAWQYNVLARELNRDEETRKKIKLYSYDANRYAFPAGLKFLSSPPEDLTGELEEYRGAGLPAMYIFPAGKKLPPYLAYAGVPEAGEMLAYIMKVITNDLKRSADDFKTLGTDEKDAEEFSYRIKNEGIIKLPADEGKDQHDEL